MPLIKSSFLSTLLVLSLSQMLLAQANTDSTKISITSNTDRLYRPQVELGAGVLTYFGDIGNLGGHSTAHTLDWGYNLGVRNKINDAFGLNFSVLFGNLSGMERFKNDAVNFQSSVRSLGASITYNFDNFLPKERLISPYVSVGVSSFEFNPKGDLYDANGLKYYTWSDGTLRSMPQNDNNAKSASILERDNVYETDLRSSNEDPNAYALRSIAFPVGAGVEVKVSDAFTFRAGAEMFLTLTDNLDNVSSTENSPTTGKKGNDKFLYSSVGLAYNLHYFKNGKEMPDGVSKEDLQKLEYEDEDGDGVADIIDQCPFTPTGTSVTNMGCPLDADEDGVADYLDKEPNSAKGAMVNGEGVTLTDAAIASMYESYLDSTGKTTFAKSQLFTADVGKGSGSRTKGFRIEFFNTEALQGDDIAQLLSISDVRAEETENGTVYYVGDFQSLEETVERTIGLKNLGLDTRVVFKEFGTSSEVDQTEIELLANTMELVGRNSDLVTFRVQIGAYRYRLSKNLFRDVPGLLVVEGNDGLTRYVSGSYPSIKDAAEHKIDLLLKGFEGSFVTAYKGGKRITLHDAGATVNEKEDISGDKSSGNINAKFVNFSVQLGSFQGRVPAEVLGQYMTLGNVRPVRGENGNTTYVYGNYDSFEKAAEGRKAILSEGFDESIVVGEFNGQVIDGAEAKKIKGE